MGLPAIVIGGYLGAGKTTLVNHLLRQAQVQVCRRIAVLVNDFGDINIDADLIEGQQGDVLALSGGCICCSFGADLVGALESVAQREPAPDVVLIESSGVALPGLVARSAKLARGISLDAVVVVADAETLRERAADIYVGDTVMQQLRDADLLLLNKTDLVSGAALRGLHRWLDEQTLRAPMIDISQGAIEPDVVLGLQQRPRASLWGGTPTPRDIFESRSIELPYAVDPPALAAQLALCTLRAKGWVHDAHGQRWLVQVVGTRWSVTPAPPSDEAAGLVLIGLKHSLAGLMAQPQGAASIG